jgi:hypothetical protein
MYKNSKEHFTKVVYVHPHVSIFLKREGRVFFDYFTYVCMYVNFTNQMQQYSGKTD